MLRAKLMLRAKWRCMQATGAPSTPYTNVGVYCVGTNM